MTLCLLASCTTTEDRIKKEATGYLNATAAYDVDEACKYCTDETAAGLKLVQQTILPQLDSNYLNQNKQATISLLGVEQVNDTMAKVIYSKVSPVTCYSDTLKMLRRNGKWMAHAPMAVPPIAKKSTHTFHYDTTQVLYEGGK